MIFAVLGAVAVGLSLGVFGSGGSILTVPVLVYLLHHGEKAAIAESLAVVGGVALASSIPYAAAGHVDWRTALVFGLPGMVGTYLGAWTAAFVTGGVQLLVFAGVMIVAAVQMWRRSMSPAPVAPSSRSAGRAIGKIALDGLAVGALTGFVGVGGGFLIVPALVLLGGLTMTRAVATSLVIIALKSITGLWKYLDVLADLAVPIDWTTIAIFIALGTAGSFVGRAINEKVPHLVLQRGFAVFLLVMSAFILFREARPTVLSPRTSHGSRPDAVRPVALACPA